MLVHLLVPKPDELDHLIEHFFKFSQVHFQLFLRLLFSQMQTFLVLFEQVLEFQLFPAYFFDGLPDLQRGLLDSDYFVVSVVL